MNALIFNNIAGNPRDQQNLQKLRQRNSGERYKKRREYWQRRIKERKREFNVRVVDDVFPDPPPEPEPVLTKNLIRDYILFDRVDDLGKNYRYGVFAVFSSFVKLDEDGNYLDPTKASNVLNETRVLTVKSLIDPETFGSNSKGEPIFIERDPVIEFLVADESPTAFVDRIYLYEFGAQRAFELKKNARKIVERDEMEDVVDPMGTPYSIESAISENQMYYNRHIHDLYHIIVNMNYVSSTPYEILMQTIIVMLGI
jgi:hypothetical protein